MDNKTYQSLVKNAAKPRFKGKKRVIGKYIPKYPVTAEREFQRICRAYVRLYKSSLKNHLQKLMEAYKGEIHQKVRFDVGYDPSFESVVDREIVEIAAELEKALHEFGLEDQIRKISRITQNTNIREWRNAVREAIGLDIFEDYYKGELYEQMVQRWVAENVKAIKLLPKNSLSSLRAILIDGYRNGMLVKDIQKQIQHEYNTTKRYAELLARDQVATLNSQLTKMQHIDAGVNRFKWSDSDDGRVRDSHREFNGNIYSYDDPPEGWYMTKGGKKMTGRKCIPGEDYCCRCCAIPVFDFETLNLPMDPPKMVPAMQRMPK